MKKAAVINDFSGFGRCSLSVALPVLSVCGVQCCSIPTAVFTNHTGYPSFRKEDLTDFLPDFIREWQKLSLSFDAIATGYLSSPGQVAFSEAFIKRFFSGAKIVVDPVMGDNGRLYNGFSPETAQRLGELVCFADIITPNLTEACILTDMDYEPNPSNDKLREIGKKISEFSFADIVITGIEADGVIKNVIITKNSFDEYATVKTAPTRSGTGDLFSSVITVCAAKGIPLERGVKIAADFVKEAAEISEAEHIPPTDGAAFEPILHKLPKLFD
ncbi:MAG: pyridoxamine kinase [Ruminococcus sp.]|jgi:pyridoxine kinase|nr:pyridoxamine kinase [Ruminococcus sp.]